MAELILTPGSVSLADLRRIWGGASLELISDAWLAI